MQKNPYPGKFIVFDGLDGSGISTQAAALVDYLNRPEQKLRYGHTGVFLTKEPTSGLIGGLIRGQLSHEWKSSPECLQLLFSADRAHHLKKEIIPLLEKGIIVICDRYFFVTIAYGSLEIKDKDWLVNLSKNFLLPDIAFFLKVSPKICIERINKTRYGFTLFEEEEILERAWKNFENLAQEFKNISIIDGARPVQKIAKEITDIIDEKLG